MIYFDNAATTFPKPQQVLNASFRAAKLYGANPGRSGHQLSMAAAEEVYACRQEASSFFHALGPECVAFTLNCTHAVNMVLKGLLNPGDHVVVSNLEHNAVMRPLYALAQKGVSYTLAQVVPGDHDATLDAFRKALQPNTRLVVCTHASNVLGIRLPIERIAALTKQYGIPILVDSAQSAGVLPIDIQDFGIDYLCCAGHKGLYGPMGTGMLITEKGSSLSTIIEGGTGTFSADLKQPETVPDRLESGTPNLPGICGLRAGIRFVKGRGVSTIFRHEMGLVQELYDQLSKIDGVHLYTDRPDPAHYAPVLSFNIREENSEKIAAVLDQNGIAVRAGLHCAPSAHTVMGTLEQGAVRVCPSAFNNRAEIHMLASVCRKLAMKK